MQPSDIVIKFENVTKRFAGQTAVDNVNLSASVGETVALLGPSGCGKTTTLRLIAGFETPDSGFIEIAGESMAGKRPYERNVGLLFQHYALFPHMNVYDNIAYGLRRRGWPKPEIEDRVEAMLKLVQLSGFELRKPREMSGGQQQRVALARVLATEPKLILLDEPLSALDAKMREELRIELKQILLAVGSTAIVVTHDQDEAMSLADRIIVMNRGRVEQQGQPDDIYAKPASAFVAKFIGRTNWFHGTIAAVDPIVKLVTASGTTIHVAGTKVSVNEGASVCVRPERMALAMSGMGAATEFENALPAVVLETVSMGSEIHYAVDCGEDRMTVIETNRNGQRYGKGDRVKLIFEAADCMVFAYDRQ